MKNILFDDYLRMHRLLLNLLVITKLSLCERRVTNGSRLDPGADTSFVVYIVKKESGDTPGWVCGGSIIHPSLVLTSAACLKNAGDYLYVVAGYRKYVPSEDLETDECTKNLKHRIRSYCVHRDYATSAGKVPTKDEKMYQWTKYDIAVARTLHPIDFYDNYYLKFCSYRPSSVGVNYNSKYEDYGDAVVYGWGHDAYYRPEGDTTDYNQLELRYASSYVLPRIECQHYFENEYVKDRVGNSYICTDGNKGNLDSRGVQVYYTEEPFFEECDYWLRRTGSNEEGVACSQNRNLNESRSQNRTDAIRLGNTRRNGICQNDHGSPLVIWIGGHPYAAGVASAFHVNKNMECVGPYLYTSVSCTSVFIHCILREQTTLKTRRSPSICDDPKERGFFLRNVEIDWSKEDF